LNEVWMSDLLKLQDPLNPYPQGVQGTALGDAGREWAAGGYRSARERISRIDLQEGTLKNKPDCFGIGVVWIHRCLFAIDNYAYRTRGLKYHR